MGWLKLPVSVVVFFQVTAVFAATGFLLAALISGDRQRWPRVPGTGEKPHVGVAVTSRFALLGALVALVYIVVFVAEGRGARLAAIPGFDLLAFGALGAVVLLTVILAMVGEGRRPTPPEASLGALCGAAGAMLLAGALSHGAAAATVVAWATLGWLAGVAWPLKASRARWLVFRVTGWVSRPRPIRLRTREMLWAGIAALVGIAVVAAPGPRAPWWLAAALLGALVVALSATRRVSRSEVTTQHRDLAGYRTTVILANVQLPGRARQRKRRGSRRAVRKRRDVRRGEGPPVVFVHGVGHAARVWSELIMLLTWFSGRPFAAISLPGIARGVGPLGAGDKLPQLVDWLRRAIQKLFPGEQVLGVGHSLGAGLLLMLAQDDPATGVLCAVIGLNTLGLQTHPLIRAGGLRLVQRLVMLLPFTPPRVRVGTAVWAYSKVYPDSTEETLALVKYYAREVIRNPKEAHRWREVLPDILRERRDALAKVLDVRLPTHLFFGGQDLISPPLGAAHVKAERPDIWVTIESKWDHGPHIHRPSEVAHALLRSPAWQVPASAKRPRPDRAESTERRPRHWRRR